MVLLRKLGIRFYFFFIISNKNNVVFGGFCFFSILYKFMKFCCFGVGVRISVNVVFIVVLMIL